MVNVIYYTSAIISGSIPRDHDAISYDGAMLALSFTLKIATVCSCLSSCITSKHNLSTW